MIALGHFLADDGIVLIAPPAEATDVMLAVARGEVSIEQLAEWLTTRTLRPGA